MTQASIHKVTGLLLVAFVISKAPNSREGAVFADQPAQEQALPRLKPHREPVLASPQEAALARQLEKPVRAGSFFEIPLRDVFESLRKWDNVRVEVAPHAANEIHLRLKQEVTLDHPRMPLRVLLHMLLEPAGLDWIIRNDKLLIVPRAEVDSHISRWIYDINDLVAAGISSDDFAAAIRDVVAPKGWEGAGGNGSIAIEQDRLIVAQRRDIHKQVLQTLRFVREELAEHRRTAGTRNSRMFTIRYSLDNLVEPDVDIAEIAAPIITNVFRDTWETTHGVGKISIDYGKLEVTHFAWVHDRLRLLLDLIREIASTDSNGMPRSFESRAREALNLLDTTPLPAGDIDQPRSIDFQSMELPDVMFYFHRECGVICQITGECRARISVDRTDVTCSQKQGSLGSALDLILEPLKLDWFVVHDGLVQVVPPEVAAMHRGVQVYRIRELVEAGTSETEIIHKITRQVEPRSWEAHGGTALIRKLTPGLLIVSHNRRAHAQISRILAEIGQP